MTSKSLKAAEIKNVVEDLTKQATELREQVKDGIPAEDARKLERDHDTVLIRLEAARQDLDEAETREAEAAEAEAIRDAERSKEDRQEISQRITDAVGAERKRTADIREIGAKFNIPDELIATHCREATSVSSFREIVLETLVANQEKQGGPVGGAHNRGVEVGQDETVTRREAMMEYIAARNNYGVMTERARELYRGMSCIDLIRETESWKGNSTRGMLPDEIAQRGLMTTSDFPFILQAVANKTLRAAYEAAPRTFTAWTRSMSLTDFKVYNILRRSGTPQLKLVNEAGEFKRGALTESKETISLKTYGVVVGLTRQLIINDDLGALTGIPADFAQSAASLESDLVYHKLLANAALAQDSVALFSVATHNNLVSSGTAIDVIPISGMRVRMAKQTDLDGLTVLNIYPNILLVPPELATRAEQLTTTFSPALNASINPQWVRSLTPVVEARLSVGISNLDAGLATQAGSATAYYLVSSQYDSILWATLNGQASPYTENRIGFDVDGVEIKCRHDFGVAAVDFRAIQKELGA